MTYEELLDKWIRKLGRDCTAGEIVHDLRQLEQPVRCKDCKHSFGELATRGGVWNTDAKHLFCNMTKRLMSVDDYCSWGERREDGKE